MRFLISRAFLIPLTAVILLIIGLSFIPNRSEAPPPVNEPLALQEIPENEAPDKSMKEDEANNLQVTLKTNMGDITLELYLDKTPITAGNFIKLAKSGFYDNTKFHRVISGFMIQGGDPNSKGTNTALYGTGGPGYTIQDEFVSGLSNVRGTISMANTGQPNSGGSQFFINLIDNIGLDYDKPPIASSHPVFGRVLTGIEIVDAIAKVQTGPRDIPVNPVIIKKILIENEPR